MLWRFKSFLIPQHQLVLAIFVRQIRNPLAIRGPSREALVALGRIGYIACISLLTMHRDQITTRFEQSTLTCWRKYVITNALLRIHITVAIIKCDNMYGDTKGVYLIVG